MMTSSVFSMLFPAKIFFKKCLISLKNSKKGLGCEVLSLDLQSKTGHPGNPRGRTKSSLNGVGLRISQQS